SRRGKEADSQGNQLADSALLPRQLLFHRPPSSLQVLRRNGIQVAVPLDALDLVSHPEDGERHREQHRRQYEPRPGVALAGRSFTPVGSIIFQFHNTQGAFFSFVAFFSPSRRIGHCSDSVRAFFRYASNCAITAGFLSATFCFSPASLFRS